MIFEFGSTRIDVDVERTRRWHETAPTPSQWCDCDGCLNYERAARLFPESVASFLDALGTQVKKPIEVYVNGPNEDGTLFYGGWYYLCGAVLSAGDDEWLVAEGAPFGPRGFRIFIDNSGPPAKDFPEPVLRIGILADIPWALEKKNSYL